MSRRRCSRSAPTSRPWPRRRGVSVPGALSVRDAYRAREGVPERLVLLYDELDRYAKSPVLEDRRDRAAGADLPGRHFFNSLESMRRNAPGVGILAAGSIGVFAFRDVLGSSFLACADKVRIEPFDQAAIQTLARPFAEHGRELSEATIESLYLASGGNPALVTYGLGALWGEQAPNEHTAAAAFVRFQTTNSEFLRDLVMAFADPALSQAPQRAWDLIRDRTDPSPSPTCARPAGRRAACCGWTPPASSICCRRPGWCG